MATPLLKKRLKPGVWSIESNELMYNGKPRIDLTTITKAHYTAFNPSGFGSGGLRLSSPTKTVLIYQVQDQKRLRRTLVKTLEALHKKAPDVQVHMRGGMGACVTTFGLGVSLLGLVAWFVSVMLMGDSKAPLWQAMSFLLLVGLLGGFLVKMTYPWNSQRFYATPKQAARAIKRHGWQAPYKTYGSR